MPPVLLLNAVGLTPRLLAHAPRLKAVADAGWVRPLTEVTPAVTCSAQATLLTGEPVSTHGVVANGWLFRDTMEVRFWQQSHRLVRAEPIAQTARLRAAARGTPFTSAKLFWWFNQGAPVDISLTPKPYYGADGNKAFGVSGTPAELPARLERELGRFPFPSFWGPMAGLPATEWIASASAKVLRESRPDLTLVYLPHLDYEPQRRGPAGCDMPRLVGELDAACAPLLDAARHVGSQVWVVSEYGHCDVTTAVFPNRALRAAGLLAVRDGPFGESLDTFASRAFAVADHQLAHVYVRDVTDIGRARDLLAPLAGVGRVLGGEEIAAAGLAHERSGELILLSEPNAWFAYPFWLDDARAPDYARTVAIHAKPGFDPCELFFDPQLRAPKLRAARRLAQKKLGFRTLFDVVPLDASVVGGSHGLPAADPLDRAILIGHGAEPGADVAMTAVRDLLLEALGV